MNHLLGCGRLAPSHRYGDANESGNQQGCNERQRDHFDHRIGVYIPIHFFPYYSGLAFVQP